MVLWYYPFLFQNLIIIFIVKRKYILFHANFYRFIKFPCRYGQRYTYLNLQQKYQELQNRHFDKQDRINKTYQNMIARIIVSEFLYKMMLSFNVESEDSPRKNRKEGGQPLAQFEKLSF